MHTRQLPPDLVYGVQGDQSHANSAGVRVLVRSRSGGHRHADVHHSGFRHGAAVRLPCGCLHTHPETGRFWDVVPNERFPNSL